MKVPTLLFTLLTLTAPLLTAAVPSADANPAPSADAAPNFDRFCHLPGMGCSKVKRAAEAAAAALAQPEPIPEPAAEPWYRFCHLAGMGCSKAKRSAEALGEVVARAYEVAHPDPATAQVEMQRLCDAPGMPCSKVKNAAQAIESALAPPDPQESDPHMRFCHLPGMGCSKARRAQEEMLSAARNAVQGLGSEAPARQDTTSSAETGSGYGKDAEESARTIGQRDSGWRSKILGSRGMGKRRRGF